MTTRFTMVVFGLALTSLATLAWADGAQERVQSGEVTARRPPGPAWSCEPRARTGEGFRLNEVQCRGAFRQGDVRLYAKDYAGPKESVDEICARDWKAYYRPALIADRVDARVQREPERVCAVEAEGVTSDGARITIREWYAVVPGHVRIVGATVPATLASQSERSIGTWRAGVQFGTR